MEENVTASEINFKDAFINALKILIIKPFTLPYKIYLNTLKDLTNTSNEGSLEKTISSDFPLYVWLIGYYDALIALIYPIGVLVLLIMADESDGTSILLIPVLYFVPLILGLIKELLSVTLKNLFYLKKVSEK
jgi:hypothetical protein